MRRLKYAFMMVVGSAAFRVDLLVKLMQYLRKRGHRRLAKLCSMRLEHYGNYISNNAIIGSGLNLPHPTSIVIGDGVVIGDNVKIYQSVTLGGRIVGDWKKRNYPTISDNVVIFSGAVVVGKVTIGRNCVIGANSVVLIDIPDNATAIGVPARIRYNRFISKSETTKND